MKRGREMVSRRFIESEVGGSNPPRAVYCPRKVQKRSGALARSQDRYGLPISLYGVRGASLSGPPHYLCQKS